MGRETEQLNEMIRNSSNIVFSAAPAYPPKAVFRTFGAWTGYIIRNTIIRRKRF